MKIININGARNPQMRTKIVYFVQYVILSNTLYKTIEKND